MPNSTSAISTKSISAKRKHEVRTRLRNAGRLPEGPPPLYTEPSPENASLPLLESNQTVLAYQEEIGESSVGLADDFSTSLLAFAPTPVPAPRIYFRSRSMTQPVYVAVLVEGDAGQFQDFIRDFQYRCAITDVVFPSPPQEGQRLLHLAYRVGLNPNELHCTAMNIFSLPSYPGDATSIECLAQYTDKFCTEQRIWIDYILIGVIMPIIVGVTMWHGIKYITSRDGYGRRRSVAFENVPSSLVISVSGRRRAQERDVDVLARQNENVINQAAEGEALIMTEQLNQLFPAAVSNVILEYCDRAPNQMPGVAPEPRRSLRSVLRDWSLFSQAVPPRLEPMNEDQHTPLLSSITPGDERGSQPEGRDSWCPRLFSLLSRSRPLGTGLSSPAPSTIVGSSASGSPIPPSEQSSQFSTPGLMGRHSGQASPSPLRLPKQRATEAEEYVPPAWLRGS